MQSHSLQQKLSGLEVQVQGPRWAVGVCHLVCAEAGYFWSSASEKLLQLAVVVVNPNKFDLFVEGIQNLYKGIAEYGLEYLPEVFLCCTEEDI